MSKYRLTEKGKLFLTVLVVLIIFILPSIILVARAFAGNVTDAALVNGSTPNNGTHLPAPEPLPSPRPTPPEPPQTPGQMPTTTPVPTPTTIRETPQEPATDPVSQAGEQFEPTEYPNDSRGQADDHNATEPDETAPVTEDGDGYAPEPTPTPTPTPLGGK